MRCYLIQNEQITALAAAPAEPTEGILLSRAADLDPKRFPIPKIIAMRNALPGVAPIRRFADRKKAVQALWAALGKLPIGLVKEGSKQELVKALISRPEGADIEELMSATGWQRHSVRGLLSGTFRKRLGLAVESKVDGNTRVYRIAA